MLDVGVPQCSDHFLGHNIVTMQSSLSENSKNVNEGGYLALQHTVGTAEFALLCLFSYSLYTNIN